MVKIFQFQFYNVKKPCKRWKFMKLAILKVRNFYTFKYLHANKTSMNFKRIKEFR